MADPEDEIIEEAIQTLQQLMGVLQSLDDNLKALYRDVHEATSEPGSFRQSMRKSLGAIRTDEIAASAGQIGSLIAKIPGSKGASANESAHQLSLSEDQAPNSGAQLTQESMDVSAAAVEVSGPGNATADAITQNQESPKPSEQEPEANSTSVRGSPRQSITQSQGPEANRTTPRGSMRQSIIQNRESPKASVQVTEANRTTPRGSMRQSVTQNRDSLKTGAGSNGGSERKSIRKSTGPDGQPKSKQSTGYSERNSKVERRPSQKKTHDKESRQTQAEVAGRLTKFLKQFDNYVSDISGKIDTLNDRVVALSDQDQKEPKNDPDSERNDEN